MTTQPPENGAGVCEICAAGSSADVPAATPRTRVLIEDRFVALCDGHFAEVERAGIERLRDLFAWFKEQGGQRGAPERRSPLDRRVFPARPEGRRRGGGRRTNDSD